MDKRKFNRFPEDVSQQQMFVEDVCDSINELEQKPAGTKLYRHKGTIERLNSPDGFFKVVYNIVSNSATPIETYSSFITNANNAVDINIFIDPDGNDNLTRILLIKQELIGVGDKNLYYIIVYDMDNDVISTSTIFDESYPEEDTTIITDTVTAL